MRTIVCAAGSSPYNDSPMLWASSVYAEDPVITTRLMPSTNRPGPTCALAFCLAAMAILPWATACSDNRTSVTLSKKSPAQQDATAPGAASQGTAGPGAVNPPPPSNCGTTGTTGERIANCNEARSGAANSCPNGGNWTLVSRVISPALYEVWRDEGTGLIWSDRVGDPTTSIDPDNDAFTANWCQAAGSISPNDYHCYLAMWQNQTAPESWCGDANRGAAMKGSLGSGENITWRLPTIDDWRMADSNGIRCVLPKMNFSFWSASNVTDGHGNVWVFNAHDGSVSSGNRLGSASIRCVGAR